MVNEIDEIFASKPSGSGMRTASSTTPNGSGKTKPSYASSLTGSANLTSSSKKKEKRQRKAVEASKTSASVSVKPVDEEEEEWGGIVLDDDSNTVLTSVPKPAKGLSVVEVVDVSKPTRVDLPKPPKSKGKLAPTSLKRSARDDEDDTLFKDSRGTGPRRKTEEGYRVFKEDELGINDTGGDTPDCPFDCNCCF